MATKPKILLVEDNENNRYLAQFLLQHQGFDVALALDGKQALDLARRDPPSLVVMDIQIPEMDGYETALRFKNEPTLAHIPLVGVSSYALAGDRAKALDAGFAGYIEKPINPDTFVQEVKSFIEVAPDANRRSLGS